jgi:DNA-binding NarL/FixJ family response regulator
MSIRVLLCDDQDVVCDGLRAILAGAPDCEVVGAASDGARVLPLIEQVRPDVVLMDLKMPVLNGVQATREITARFPGVRVLVLTTHDGDEWVYDAIRAGAAGYILKDTPRERLLDAVRDAAAGRTPVDPGVAGKLFASVADALPKSPDPHWLRRLSEREREVLALLAHGLSNADIAARLYLSEGTVRNYVSGLLAKLGVADRTQAAVLALRHGLADLGESGRGT